ncbi:MAG: ATP-binding cassette domain-containing protein [Pseudomonadota bacterium]
MSFVTIHDVWLRYGPVSVLERVNLDVAEGEFVSIVGASGCGKSSFLRLMLGQEHPSRGVISVEGRPPAVEPGPERGIVFQRYSVFPHLTVRDNIVAAEEFGAGRALGRFWGAARRQARQRAEEILERIGLGAHARAWPHTLSGGQQQRLAIAQALAARPRVLLLDEPFGALDPGTRLTMHDFVGELRAESPMTVFMVTHDLEEGFKLGDRVVVFDKPRHDPTEPTAYGATITYDFDARNGGIPFQRGQSQITLAALADEPTETPR